MNLCLSADAPAVGSPVLTTIQQLRALAQSGKRETRPVRLNGTVLEVSAAASALILKDDSGTALLAADLPPAGLLAGAQVVLEGSCTVQGRRFSLRGSPVVENDGVQPMTERAGTVFLTPGKHAMEVLWFDNGGDVGLEVYYQGPGLPRQRIPNAALYRPVANSAGAAADWSAGLNYRAYEGLWTALPDFSRLTHVKVGTTTNFNVDLRTRTNEVGLDFAGYVEVPREGIYTFTTISDDGSRLFIDPQPGRVTVVGTNELPRPSELTPGQPLSAGEENQWCRTQGVITYVGRQGNDWELELESDAGRIQAQISGASPALANLWLRSRVAATGLSQMRYALNGQQVAGEFLIPGPEQIRVLASAPEQWNEVPLSPIADLLRTNFSAEAEALVHVRGEVRDADAHAVLQLSDGTGQIRLEMPEAPKTGTQIEVLGLWRRHEGRTVIQSACYRDLASRENGPLPLLTTVAQVHNLKSSEARRGYPVRIRGVVTCAWPWTPNGVIQDATRGVFVPILEVSPGQFSHVGDYLEVEGYTGPGDFAPIVESKRVTRLGQGMLPEPARPTWDQLMNGSMDMQFVEIEGIITAVQDDEATFLMPEGRIQVLLGDFRMEAKRFENARVRMRGCLSASWDQGTRMVRSGTIQIHTPSICVEEPAPPDLFAMPLRRAWELKQFDAGAGALRRVKLSGQIVQRRNNEYYLMDGTNGVRFVPKQSDGLAIGDQVDVVGFPELGTASPLLRDVEWRVTGKAALPPACPLTADSLLSRDYDATVVKLESRLVGIRFSPTEQILELQAGPRTYLARLESKSGRWVNAPVGSRLSLTGVYSGQGVLAGRDFDLDSFELLLNSPADVVLLERPPWWNVKHTLTVFGGLSGTLLLAFAWIRALRSQVEQRTRELRQEIEERKRMESEVERVHKQLLIASRQAGMAEVATSVLHNVGNVLNSVNISAALVAGNLKKSGVSRLPDVADMLIEHAPEPSFLIDHDKGKKIPGYLKNLSERVAQEQEINISELESLQKNIEHIKGIIMMQQKYARLGGLSERIKVSEVIEDSIRINANSLAREKVQLVRAFHADPEIVVEKHKMLQILVNLIQNARQACAATSRNDRQITLKVERLEPGQVRVQVIDNGVGIAAEHMEKIFTQGFTTRKDGHGFGLHSCLIAAQEMDAVLLAHSDGSGKGAVFTLTLPLNPPDDKKPVNGATDRV